MFDILQICNASRISPQIPSVGSSPLIFKKNEAPRYSTRRTAFKKEDSCRIARVPKFSAHQSVVKIVLHGATCAPSIE